MSFASILCNKVFKEKHLRCKRHVSETLSYFPPGRNTEAVGGGWGHFYDAEARARDYAYESVCVPVSSLTR